MKKITFLPLFLLITQVALSQADAPYFQDFNAIVAGGDNSSIVENWNQYSYGAQTNDGDIWNEFGQSLYKDIVSKKGFWSTADGKLVSDIKNYADIYSFCTSIKSK